MGGCVSKRLEYSSSSNPEYFVRVSGKLLQTYLEMQIFLFIFLVDILLAASTSRSSFPKLTVDD